MHDDGDDEDAADDDAVANASRAPTSVTCAPNHTLDHTPSLHPACDCAAVTQPRLLAASGCVTHDVLCLTHVASGHAWVAGRRCR